MRLRRSFVELVLTTLANSWLVKQKGSEERSLVNVHVRLPTVLAGFKKIVKRSQVSQVPPSESTHTVQGS